MEKTSNQDEPKSWSNKHEDEIDLRPYIETLFKWWREILCLVILLPLFAAIGSIIIQLLGPSTYTARATVIVARTEKNTIFDDRLETVINYYSAEYTNALVGLVYSGSVAQNVVDDLVELLSEEESNPSTLLENISAASRNALPNMNGNSDLIVIKAESDTAEKAAAIANSWANYYVDEVYQIFGEIPDELIESMQTQLGNAESGYETAQAELNKFVASSPMLMLERQITNTLTIADSLLENQSELAIERLTLQPNSDVEGDIFAASVGQEALAQVDRQIRKLQSELESERATYQVLSEKRDIAWEAWKTSKSSIDEMRREQLSMRRQVNFASPAVPPEEPNEVISVEGVMPMAALLGLLLGIFIAFLSEFMGRQPIFADKNHILTRSINVLQNAIIKR